jgi:hypothetical protein
MREPASDRGGAPGQHARNDHVAPAREIRESAERQTREGIHEGERQTLQQAELRVVDGKSGANRIDEQAEDEPVGVGQHSGRTQHADHPPAARR